MIIPFLFNIRNKVLPLHKLTDEQLMERVSAHDDDRAYDELYHRHARKLMGFFFRQVNRDEALAADLLQDAFMRVWASRDTYSGAAFLTWLYSIAYNLCKNHFRHESYVMMYEEEVKITKSEEYVDDFECQLDKESFDETLQTMLQNMPPAQRMLFSLRFEEELTVPQIAKVLDILEGTVKSRLHTLIVSLKNKLQHYGKL